MNNSVLQFSLGLEAGGFINPLKAQYPGAIRGATDANTTFENAKSYRTQSGELRQSIVDLQNKLGVTTNRQRALTPLELQKNHLDSLQKMSESIGHTNIRADAGTQFEKMGFVMNGTSSLAGQQLEVLMLC